MTERELEQRVRAWCRDRADAAGPLPLTLRMSVSEIPEAMPARPNPFASRRGLLMLTAAALLVAMLVGGAIAVGAGLLRWLDRDTDRNPAGMAQSWVDQPMTNRRSGDYYLELRSRPALDAPVLRVTFTLPGGWERVELDHFLWGQTKWLGFAVATNVYERGCGPDLSVRDPPVGPTVEDLALAVSSVDGWETRAVTDITLDGYAGKRVDLVAPADLSQCTGEEWRLLRIIGSPPYAPAIRESEPMSLWILDVDGDRIVIHTGYELGVSQAALDELQSLADSVRIEKISPPPAS